MTESQLYSGNPLKTNFFAPTPPEITARIFESLPNKDKNNAALVCKNWRYTLNKYDQYRNTLFLRNKGNKDKYISSRSIQCNDLSGKAMCYITAAISLLGLSAILYAEIAVKDIDIIIRITFPLFAIIGIAHIAICLGGFAQLIANIIEDNSHRRSIQKYESNTVTDLEKGEATETTPLLSEANTENSAHRLRH